MSGDILYIGLDAWITKEKKKEKKNWVQFLWMLFWSSRHQIQYQIYKLMSDGILSNNIAIKLYFYPFFSFITFFMLQSDSNRWHLEILELTPKAVLSVCIIFIITFTMVCWLQTILASALCLWTVRYRWKYLIMCMYNVWVIMSLNHCDPDTIGLTCSQNIG